MTPGPAPAVMSTPARWLAAVAGREASDLVPAHLVQLRGPQLDILVYPSDLLVSGKKNDVARARAAIASRLVTSAAYLTVTAEGQAIEDRIMALARGGATAGGPPPFDERARTELQSIDEQLAATSVEYDEWEVLYRMRLQVERDLRARLDPGASTLGAEIPGASRPGPAEAIAKVGDLVAASAAAVVEAGTDKETQQALDRLAGRRWRLVAAATSVALEVGRAVFGGKRDGVPADGRKRSGEPAAFPRPDDQLEEPRP